MTSVCDHGVMVFIKAALGPVFNSDWNVCTGRSREGSWDLCFHKLRCEDQRGGKAYCPHFADEPFEETLGISPSSVCERLLPNPAHQTPELLIFLQTPC